MNSSALVLRGRCFSYVCFVLLASIRLNAAVYYVDPSGSDGNNGTSSSTAWQTLSHVSSKTFAAGDQILFKRGAMFSGALQLKGSGTPTNPIVVDQYGTSGAKPIIAGNTDGNIHGAAVLIQNEQGWDIRNLEITNINGRLGLQIYKDTAGDSLYYHLSGLVIHNVKGLQGSSNDRSYGGIQIRNANAGLGKLDQILVSGCTIYDVKYIGVQTNVTNSSNWATNSRATNLVIHDCGQDGIIWRGNSGGILEYIVAFRTGQNKERPTAAIWMHDAVGSKMQYCEAYENTDGPNQPDGMGFDFDINVNSSFLQYCYSHDNEGGFAMVCPGGSTSNNNTMRYNISQNDKEKLLWFQGASGTKIYNNVLYGPTTGLSKVVKDTFGSNTVFRNNIIVNQTNAVYEQGSGVGTWEKNIYFGTHPTNEPAEAGKITADPRFVNPASGGTGRLTVDGYKLQPGSPALNAGVLVASNGGLDYWGNTVSASAAPNIGAYNGAGVVATDLISDDFEDGNTTGWIFVSGTWTVVADGTNVLRQSATTGQQIGVLGDPNWKNYFVSGRVKPVTAGGAPGIIGRYVDASNYYLLRIHESLELVQLYKFVGGTATLLQEAPLTINTNTWYNLRLAMNGTTLTGYVNGNAYITVTDGSLIQGKIGVRTATGEARFDDVGAGHN